MKWMKFTDFEGDIVWLNMALAECLYTKSHADQIVTRIVFSNDRGVAVKDTPEEIIARGEWTVK